MEADATPAARVRTEIVKRSTPPLEEETAGTVRVVKRATVESKISAIVEELPVVAGQSVKAGDRIALLDVREIRSRLEQARTQWQQAGLDAVRARALAQQNAMPRQELEAVESREKVLQALVRETETQLGYGILAAPFDGVVTRRLAEQGDLATPGRPLVEIEDPSHLRLETDVPETLAGGLEVGRSLPLHIPALALEGAGVIAEISPVADPDSRTVRVKLDLLPTPALRPGMFGRVRIPAGTVETLLLPPAALVVRGQLEMVFVAEGSRVRLRLVRAGRVRDGRIEILSGLSEGERVVVDGAEPLLDGQRLEVLP